MADDRTPDLARLTTFAMSLAGQFPGALKPEIAHNVRMRLDKDMEDDARYIGQLIRQRANADEDAATAKIAAQRLSSPRNVTTPRGERRRTIARNMLKSASALADHLGPAIEAAIRIELLRFEIEQEDLRDELTREGEYFKQDRDLYIGVKIAADDLFARHHITHNDWRNASEDTLDQIAAILIAARKEP